MRLFSQNPRIELGAQAEARITELTKAGRTIDEIQAALESEGIHGVSRTTIHRRRVKAASTPVVEVPQEEVQKLIEAPPGEYPENTPLEALRETLTLMRQRRDEALLKKDDKAFNTAAVHIRYLAAEIAKRTPKKERDPNEDPDMIEIAATVMHRLVEYAEQEYPERNDG